MDLVGTCPKHFWREWVAEGDPAESEWSGEVWGWFTRDKLASLIKPGERLYIVAWGRLRGYAPVTAVRRDQNGGWIICRHGNAVACTLRESVRGFQGLRGRWWNRDSELPFPSWRDFGVVGQ